MMSKADFEERQLSMLAVTGNIKAALRGKKIARLFPPTLTPRLPKIRLNAPFGLEITGSIAALLRLVDKISNKRPGLFNILK